MTEQVWKFLLKWEGGETDNPSDYGGRTKYGVTQKTYDKYSRLKGMPLRDVFGISLNEAADVYDVSYWLPSGCESLKMPLSLAVMDTAVNFGVFRAVQFLQEAAGSTIDGILGPKTLSAANSKNPKTLALKIAERRLLYRDETVAKDPTQAVFLKGWKNRDNDLKKEIQKYGSN